MLAIPTFCCAFNTSICAFTLVSPMHLLLPLQLELTLFLLLPQVVAVEWLVKEARGISTYGCPYAPKAFLSHCYMPMVFKPFVLYHSINDILVLAHPFPHWCPISQQQQKNTHRYKDSQFSCHCYGYFYIKCDSNGSFTHTMIQMVVGCTDVPFITDCLPLPEYSPLPLCATEHPLPTEVHFCLNAHHCKKGRMGAATSMRMHMK